MTLAPHRTPLAFGDLDEVAEAIRNHGGRLSTTRRLVLEALFAAEGPVSAEYVAAGLGGRIRSLDLSSVYRNLQHLEELGVVHHVHVGHGPGLYVLETATEREYLVCERCDRVDTVDTDRLDRVRREIRAETGYEARFSHLPIVGLCAACAADPGAGRDGLHGQPHSHPHTHSGHTHDHPHTEPEHDHTDHDHQHTHGDYAHSHPHAHEQGLEDQHEHHH